MPGWNETPNYIPGDAGGACYFCGSNQRTVVTDDGPRPERLMRWEGGIDFEGNVVICEACISDLARALGWSTPEDSATSAHRLAELQHAWEAAELRAREAEEMVSMLRTYNESHPKPKRQPVKATA